MTEVRRLHKNEREQDKERLTRQRREPVGWREGGHFKRGFRERNGEGRRERVCVCEREREKEKKEIEGRKERQREGGQRPYPNIILLHGIN